MASSKASFTGKDVVDLCKKFTDVFQDLLQIRQISATLKEENNQLQVFIQEEAQKMEAAQALLADGSSGDQKDPNEDAYAQQQKIDEKQIHLSDLQIKFSELSKEIEHQQADEGSLIQQVNQLKSVCNSQQMKMVEQQNYLSLLNQKTLSQEQQNAELDKFISSQQNKFESVEKQKREIEANLFEIKDQVKIQLDQFRGLLKNNSEIKELITLEEQEILKLSDQLKNKMRRLQVLQSQQKTKPQDIQRQLEDVIHASTQIQEQKRELEEKQSYLQSKISTSFIQEEQSFEKSVDAKPSSGKKRSVARVNSQQQVVSLCEEIEIMDNQIFENQKKIKELQGAVAEQTRALQQKQEEKQDATQQLILIKDNYLQMKDQIQQKLMQITGQMDNMQLEQLAQDRLPQDSSLPREEPSEVQVNLISSQINE